MDSSTCVSVCASARPVVRARLGSTICKPSAMIVCSALPLSTGAGQDGQGDRGLPQCAHGRGLHRVRREARRRWRRQEGGGEGACVYGARDSYGLQHNERLIVSLRSACSLGILSENRQHQTPWRKPEVVQFVALTRSRVILCLRTLQPKRRAVR